MDLPALSDFILVARHGGFGRAARAAGRPKATLSRRVGELEAALGLRLFERGARALKLTEEGRALFERSGRLLTEVEETVAAIASGGERVRGRLRISAPMLFSHIAMGRIIAGFVREYPDVTVEVTTEDRAVDMIEEGYDLVIRANPDPDESLVGRAFLHDRLVVVASPAVPRPGAGEAVPAVMRPGVGRAGWAVKDGAGYAVRPVLAVSSLIMARDAVRAGAGRRAAAAIAGHERFGRRHAGAMGRGRCARRCAMGALSVAPAAQSARVGLSRLSEAGLSQGGP